MNKILPLVLLFALGCNSPKNNTQMIKDKHSYAIPEEAKIKHISLNLNVDFNSKTLCGEAAYTIERSDNATQIIMDSKGIVIEKIIDIKGNPLAFTIGKYDPIFGSALSIEIGDKLNEFVIHYCTSSDAEALQWLSPEQTAGKKSPFLFSQSQAILARTWIPCQDGPGVRFTYDATLHVPTDMLALMSATNPQTKNTEGVYHFAMKQAIPSYLMAIAVGDLEFAKIGERTGVYAEPIMLQKASYEFVDVENMLIGAENIYGPYAWERYDLLVLPTSFPFGGMENPRLTFATPTIITGDRSLTSLVAHELAHSWSGNLVTNSTWDDFWLNEGFTVYFEQRIMESLYGRDYSEMLAKLSFDGLQDEVAELGKDNPKDTHLKLDLQGRNPDDGLTAIAYDKGYLFLRMLEEAFGREHFDTFLKTYFKDHAFKTMDTETFMIYLDKNLINKYPLQTNLQINEWVYGPGLPSNCPVIKSDRFANVKAQSDSWLNNKTPLNKLETSKWSSHEWQYFISSLPDSLSNSQIAAIDQEFKFTSSGNAEVLCEWLQYSLKHNYEPAFEAARKFMNQVGRRKFLKPIYAALLAQRPDFARAVYKQARPGYHSVSTATLDEMLK